MIKIKNVTKFYKPSTYALKAVSLDIAPGEFVSVVGQSGTGKTSLIKLIIAEERPTSGQIIIGGWDITNIHPKEVPYLRRQIGGGFQDFKLLQKKTVFENVAFALETCGSSRSKIVNVIHQVLKIVGLEDKRSEERR